MQNENMEKFFTLVYGYCLVFFLAIIHFLLNKIWWGGEFYNFAALTNTLRI